MVSTLLALEPDGQQEEQFDCMLDEPGGMKGMSGHIVPIVADQSQSKQLLHLLKRGDVVSGKTNLDIAGAQIASNGGVALPPGLDIAANVRQNEQERSGRKLSEQGDKPILVVKVTDSAGRARTESSAQIGDDIFGTLNDPVNLASQMRACSFNKLNIIEGPVNELLRAAPGVVEVTIDIQLTENDRYAIHNAVTEKVNTKLGITLPGPYEQVMYVLEKCYVGCGWAAYAYINSWMSVYQDVYYKQVGVQMHEIGHNFGFAHSGGLDGQTYTDHTGLMGNPLYSDDVGRMCWNAAKTWQVGWYDDRKATFDASMVVQTYRMVGIANYDNNPEQLPVVIKLETGTSTDQFIAFNRAMGVNSDNDEADDEVTIVQTGSNGEGYSQSFLQATLRQGESHTITNWVGTGQNLIISVIDIDQDTNPQVWTATVVVSLGEMPPTPAPTPCVSGTNFKLDLVTDNYPGETAWTLVNQCTGQQQLSGGSYSNANTQYVEESCIPIAEYVFTITDTFGDGICCTYGEGSYALQYNGNTIKQGGVFGQSESVTFGSCNAAPTQAPTNPPPPTFQPTFAP
eukprot:CAMPEP_0178912114 /NCGR_PEP_ID=MMETSP0786-20121207/10078_1 /TAXON_ID=186022 /ORGANISM="Thalassionema frauenfeldii, Strain CCMP 1798" /LENGTH=568 /DNA_ID=CAMNT_0020584651 /DNA_START=624 /DNA_END=2327 /DNA_ORIENTATION=+